MRLCLLAASLGAAVPALAATPGEQDLIRDRQDRLLQEQQRRLDELRELPGKAAPPSEPGTTPDTRCFLIDSIEIKGADHLSQADRERLVKPWLSQCLGVTELNALLKAITDHYLALGLVTSRAYLPQQDLSSKHLEIQVVEGRLEGLDSSDDSGLSPRELSMTFPGKVGELLNLRDIEQMVDQLNRLPSNQAKMELVPGGSVGGSTVQVANTPKKPWRASLSRNNDGQLATGEQQWGYGLEWDSPLGIADQLLLRGGRDAVSDHQRTSHSEMLFYNLPWGWWNFSYSYSQSAYRSQAEANTFTFKQTGDTQNHQLRAERVIHRDSVSKTALNTGLAYLRSNNYIEDSRLENSSNRLSEAQFGFNHGRRIGSAFVNLDAGMQQGIGAFDAQSGRRILRSDPDARYRKYTLTLSYLQPFSLFGENLSFSSLLTGQRSEDPLYSPQRLSLGGLSSIRGYKDQSLTGDSGGYWRNDLRWSRPLNAEWLRPLLAEYGAAVGYDQGVIRGDRYNAEQHGRVSGNALELFARGQHLSASVTFAHSLERPDAVAEGESPIYFRVELLL
ncbi:ShlB/FhaC/HecB family hemolysin secretion/activation protein [Pseudomonas sp. 148P]|uniref:ShlB/FhaC/HecB family hemolysin secretion/activation protein n=2 Tax=Pseudomonas TaxID=286 RepID=A0ABU7HTK1_9PSED|nr:MULTISPECIES: ShlB/FhaC/HecB family hemolysin secretion/activation protein [unclassified Pseudomonas]MEE1923255.1 ShlB/FhaC/HecB family hemolysin secretion/activation protein [Pseudomonas sp. 147P]MEE1934870.1 ShlB/FhaC/HecB family hemolysin secretion/activation protein [Pseudomonas sp. 148P]